MKRIFWQIFLSTGFLVFLFLAIPGLVRGEAFSVSLAKLLGAMAFAFLLASLHVSWVTRSVFGALRDMSRRIEGLTEELFEKVKMMAQERTEMVAILESMIEGVLVIDGKEKVILANAACARMFGWEAREMAGRPFWEIFRHRELLDLFQRSIKRGTFEDTELAIFMPEEKILHAQVSPVLGEGGKSRGMVCVLHDITSIKRLEKIRTEFVANVSHELKTPLTSIKGFVETLLDGALEDPDASRRFLGIIDEHTGRLERLIAELLDLADAESKGPGLHLTTFDLVNLIEKTAGLYQKQIQAKRQTLELRNPDSSLGITADEEKLGQVLANLLDNAIKFTPPEGKITVESKEHDGRISVQVGDTGIGIPPEHIPRIFERFYRVDNSRSREGGGSGLGLSIVKHIVQNHGGEIDVLSTVEKGTTFTLTFPLPKIPIP